LLQNCFNSEFQLADFDCGELELNDWLKNRSLSNQSNNTSRTFVLIDSEKRVIAYYSLHTGGVQRCLVNAKTRRNTPNPIPALYLGRLAVDINHQGKGYSKALIKDIYLRAIKISDDAGFKVLAVNALNDSKVSFYQQFGFKKSNSEPLFLFKSLAQIKASFNLCE